MSKKSVLTDNAPKPLPGIYSQAIVANGFVYCSGQVPMDPSTNKLIDGDVQAHTVCPCSASLTKLPKRHTKSHQAKPLSVLSEILQIRVSNPVDRFFQI
jgi:GTP cyclohydrolase FolE2